MQVCYTTFHSKYSWDSLLMRKVSVDVLVCFFGHLRPSHCLGNGKQCYSTHHSSLKHVCVWHSGDKRLGGITGILLKVKRVLSRSDVTTWLLCFPLMLDESEAANMVGKACKPQMELKRKGQKSLLIPLKQMCLRCQASPAGCNDGPLGYLSSESSAWDWRPTEEHNEDDSD